MKLMKKKAHAVFQNETVLTVSGEMYMINIFVLVRFY